MGRRKRNDDFDRAEAITKLILLVVVLLALGGGGLAGFGKALQGLLSFAVFGVAALLALGLVFLGIRLAFRQWRLRQPSSDAGPATFEWQAPSSNPLRPAQRVSPYDAPVAQEKPAVRHWTNAEVQTALGEIDWFQFEKYCAALLSCEGYVVERKGGAQPDGGVDLIARRGGESMLVQCKHWRTWTVQEKVVREMLGSMAHFKVTHGSIYTLKGWTRPAAEFARQHEITLADAGDLAHRGLARLEVDQLDRYLKPRLHHCPKCEAEMVLRTGNFTSFWGCSTFPRCRGKLNHAGAR